ncbi:MAG: hypothetical protein ACI9W2_005226 [Gammaproteobacteria bacterium]|jgi:hypothetical protein
MSLSAQHLGFSSPDEMKPLDGHRDFTASVGSFIVVTRAGKLDVISHISVDELAGTHRIQLADLNLSAISPLVARVGRSSLELHLGGGPSPRIGFKMRVRLGDTPRVMPAIGNKAEIIGRCLDEGTLPVVAQAELESRLAAYCDGTSNGPNDTIEIPFRSLELRGHLPAELAQAVRQFALENAKGADDKATALRPSLENIRTALRQTVLCDYMMKCVWLNPTSGQIGNVQNSAEGVQFVPFDVDDPDVTSFLCALEKDHYGDFLLDYREFGCVIPTPKRSNPWLGPTIHIERREFREENAFDEFYSLYSGFKALRGIGAPVLMYKGQNPLLERSEIRFLKVSDRSLNLLQGRILEGNLLQDSVRNFTAQALVWKE